MKAKKKSSAAALEKRTLDLLAKVEAANLRAEELLSHLRRARHLVSESTHYAADIVYRSARLGNKTCGGE